MYNLTRQEASDILCISTRSIDRYIKAWKIRAKKEWKIVYVNSEDIKIMWWKQTNTANVIVPESIKIKTNKIKIDEDIFNSKVTEENTFIENEEIEETKSWLVRKKDYDKITSTFEKMFNNLRNDLNKKDNKIQELSIELWKKDEMMKNSVPIIDYKKSQFLLEESKSYLNKEVVEITNEKNRVQDKLKYEQNSNKMLIAIVVALWIIIAILWLSNT